LKLNQILVTGEKMRIVYFDLDCLRPDHLSQYGYLRNTSPSLDRITGDAVIFNRCYTSNSPCAPSRAALFSGRFGINNGVIGHHGYGEKFNYPGDSFWHDPSKPMLMRWLRLRGVKTVSFSSFADRHTAWWFCSGWSELHTFTNKQGQETADEVNRAVLPWLKVHAKDDNYFLHVHYWDIHSHYRLDEKQYRKFADKPAPDWPDEKAIKDNTGIYGPCTALDLYTGYPDEDRAPVKGMPDKITNREEFKMLIDGYDAAINFVDRHIGELLDVFESQGVLEDTVFIVSSDHGDCFGEMGQYMDHWVGAEPIHNIPLMIRIPGVTKKSKCAEYVYNLDLAPTLCDLYDFPVPGKWDGRSFIDAIKGKPFAGRETLVWDHGHGSLMRCARTKKWLFTKILHPGFYPFEEPYMLHDMENDVHQTQNVADKNPQIVKEMQEIIADWHEEQMNKHGPHDDNLQQMVPVGFLKWYSLRRMIDRLKKTGRADQVEGLVKRLQKYHKDL